MATETEVIRYPSFGDLILGFLLAIVILAGCAELPVPIRAPYRAAPPSYSAPWRPPPAVAANLAQARAAPTVTVSIDPSAVYGLADLIDFAHRSNPETRRLWEEARAGAAQVGRAEATYYPTLFFMASGGASREVHEATAPVGTFTSEGPGITPQLQLNWILLDFGRRGSSVERSAQNLFKANFAFNRKLQEIAFAVSRNYFNVEASRARVTAARATLQSAIAVEEAVGARLQEGLATRPDSLLARQERARAAFEVEDALGAVDDTRAALAESLGIAPTALMRTVELSALALPTGLADSVEKIIDRALARRPDLASRLAGLRAREAEERGATAEFWPRFHFSGSIGQEVQRYRAGPPFGRFTKDDTAYQAFINFEWKLFDGFERNNALREATALREASEAEVSALELKAIREVWKAYSDVKTALRKHEYALALLAASQEAYDSTLESYRSAGLSTVIDLLAAQRDLARARTTDIQSRAELLTTAAALTFAAGD
ncbi:MAG TPA: TolC family protein [Bryobacteraceae bacterium]|nr:TolC family protein [Bryobacteraceae bacterium]